MADRKQVNQYEAMFLVGPQAAAEPQAMIDLCRGVIERHGGQVMVIKKWDERRWPTRLPGRSEAPTSCRSSRPPARLSPASSAM